MKSLDIGYYISAALLVVFGGLSIVISKAELELSELGSESIAPENLRTSAERFRLKLVHEQNLKIRETLSESEPQQVLEALEENSASIDRMAETESWGGLELNLSQYADRIELLTKQRNSMSAIVYYTLPVTAVAMLLFSIAQARAKYRLARQGGAGSQAEPEERSR